MYYKLKSISPILTDFALPILYRTSSAEIFRWGQCSPTIEIQCHRFPHHIYGFRSAVKRFYLKPHPANICSLFLLLCCTEYGPPWHLYSIKGLRSRSTRSNFPMVLCPLCAEELPALLLFLFVHWFSQTIELLKSTHAFHRNFPPTRTKLFFNSLPTSNPATLNTLCSQS